MAKTHLLQAVLSAAMLAAVPALAQTNTETGATGAGGAANNPTAMPSTTGGSSSADTMTPGMKPMRSHHAGMEDHATHRSAMMHSGERMHGRSSQSAAVDQLNDQSYQAARNGQAFNGTNATDGSSTMPQGGSGSMNDMSGGSMSGGSNSK